MNLNVENLLDNNSVADRVREYVYEAGDLNAALGNTEIGAITIGGRTVKLTHNGLDDLMDQLEAIREAYDAAAYDALEDRRMDHEAILRR